MDLEGIISDINVTAKRLTGADGDFFRPCSLRYSSTQRPEAQYLRSVLKFYSLFCECGAASVRFCIIQSHFKAFAMIDAVESMKIIHALRTHVAHSLDSDDAAILLIAQSWFRQQIGNAFPKNEEEWEICANAVEEMAKKILESVKRFLMVIEADVEMAQMRKELRWAIDGMLRRSDVEMVVVEILNQLGRKDLSPSKCCDRYISEWTQNLKLKVQGANLLTEIRKLAEATIARIPLSPPITALEIMKALQIKPGLIMGRLVSERDRLFSNGVKDPAELLERLRGFHQQLVASPESRPDGL